VGSCESIAERLNLVHKGTTKGFRPTCGLSVGCGRLAGVAFVLCVTEALGQLARPCRGHGTSGRSTGRLLTGALVTLGAPFGKSSVPALRLMTFDGMIGSVNGQANRFRSSEPFSPPCLISPCIPPPSAPCFPPYFTSLCVCLFARCVLSILGWAGLCFSA
jgi:hypothetical protein